MESTDDFFIEVTNIKPHQTEKMKDIKIHYKRSFEFEPDLTIFKDQDKDELKVDYFCEKLGIDSIIPKDTDGYAVQK